MIDLVGGDVSPAARSLTRPFWGIVMRHSQHHIMLLKEEEDMPGYILPPLQSGVSRTCESTSRPIKADRLGPLLGRWLSMSGAGKSQPCQ
ncbi:MAG TPA: hypothetical protein VIW47_01955, partial [Nitrospiraceae bacterium]